MDIFLSAFIAAATLGFADSGRNEATTEAVEPPPPVIVTIDATMPDKVADVFRDSGYQAQLETDSDGDPTIKTSFGGISTQIFFYGCSDGRDCKEIQFSSGFDLTDGITFGKINEWNRTNRYGSAYRDDEDDPWLRETVVLDGGVTPDNVRNWIDRWDVAIGLFKDHIGF